jgi:lipopolysaccharide export system permease protein
MRALILDRHIARLVALPAFAGFALLTLLVTAFNAAILLRDAAYSRIPVEYVASLVMLRNVTAAEVLLPTALYISVLATVNRWHREREAFAFYAAGAAPARASLGAALLCVVVCAAVAGLSLFARPWAYGESYRIDRAVAELSTAAMQPDRFYTFGDTAVLTARAIDAGKGEMRDVFMEDRLPDEVRIVHARAGRIESASGGARRRVELENGTSHWISETSKADRVSAFERLVYYAPREDEERVANQRRAMPTTALLDSTRPKEVAELQWRIVLPITALFLTLIAIELGRALPGASPYPRFVAGLVVYALAFNVAAVARTWLENGRVEAMPGMLWVPFAAAFAWLALRRLPSLSLGRPR